MLRIDRGAPDPGLGVFETLLARDGRVHLLNAHLQRLRASVAELYCSRALPDDLPARVVAAARGLTGRHRVRVDAGPAAGQLEVSVTTSPIAAARPLSYVLRPLFVSGGQGRHKWRDRARLDIAGGAVGLLVDDDGTVLEAAWANVWILDGDRLITAPADGRILPGVTRARLLEIAPQLGLTAVERPIALDEARAAPALLLTSALALAAAAAVETIPGSGSVAVAQATRIREQLLGGEWA